MTDDHCGAARSIAASAASCAYAAFDRRATEQRRRELRTKSRALGLAPCRSCRCTPQYCTPAARTSSAAAPAAMHHAAPRVRSRSTATRSSLRSTGPISLLGEERREQRRRASAVRARSPDGGEPRTRRASRNAAARSRRGSSDAGDCPRAPSPDRVGDHRRVARAGAEAAHANESAGLELEHVGAIVVRDERERRLSTQRRPQRERRSRPRAFGGDDRVHRPTGPPRPRAYRRDQARRRGGGDDRRRRIASRVAASAPRRRSAGRAHSRSTAPRCARAAAAARRRAPAEDRDGALR